MTKVRDEFEFIRQYLSSGALAADIDYGEVKTPSYKRLLGSFRNGMPVPSDLASLVRHVLRCESEITGQIQRISVPQDDRWPSKAIWASHGIRVITQQADKFVIEADAWRPQWLPLTNNEPPEAVAFAGTKRRYLDSCPADPFIHSLGCSYYLCQGQKEAVRAVLTAPPGSTLVVNLPTGTGKSLCAHILSKIPFVDGESGGVTLVIVPTTALALDQERAIQALCYPTAYRSGMDEQIRANNEAIWRGVLDGTQRIVFTSPESLLGPLRNPVFSAAEHGFIKALIIDEAHMVSQWGDAFRPSFQEIPGLRRALLRICPSPKFRTVLMSATLTQSSLDTLEALFGYPGPFDMVSAVQVRPEPTYWVSLCQSLEEKVAHVFEAIHFLPRPLILYTTKIRDAEDWGQRLRQDGYQRLDVMTGDTAPEDRQRIIRKWAAAETDIIVANSAFGLGVDMPDIKCIVHACVPETLDRFYQEVGRGGRNGEASISLTIYTSKDIELAERMNRKVIIGTKFGLQRWERMFSRKTQKFSDWRVEVPIDVARRYKHSEKGKFNMHWNIFVLILMCRAGLVVLDDEPPIHKLHRDEGLDQPLQKDTEVDSSEVRHLRRVIHIIDNGHLQKEVWEKRVAPIRDSIAEASEHQLKLLKQLLRNERCAAEILAEAYSISMHRNGESSTPVIVAPSCGGCGFCHSHGIEPYSIQAAVQNASWPPHKSVGDSLLKHLAGNNVLALFYDADVNQQEELNRRRKLLYWLLKQKIRCIVYLGPKDHAFRRELQKANMLPVMIEDCYLPISIPRVPTAIFVVNEFISVTIYNQWLSKIHSPNTLEEPYVLILPDNAVDPERKDRRLRDYLSCSIMSLHELELSEIF